MIISPKIRINPDNKQAKYSQFKQKGKSRTSFTLTNDRFAITVAADA